MKNYNAPENCHIKSIVNPKMVKSIYNPHFCVYKNNKFAVNENFEKIIGAFTNKNFSNKIRINHYYCRSEEEYLKKTVRGNADNENERTLVKDYLNFPETTHDYVIQKYVPELKKRMNIKEEK